MIPFTGNHRGNLAKLFQAYTWNYLADAVLEGTMGQAWADDEQNPQVAVLEFPKLQLNVVAGDAAHPSARAYIQDISPFTALIFASAGWQALVDDVHGEAILHLPRYAFTSENLNLAHLRELSARSVTGYHLRPITLDLAERLVQEEREFSADHMINFESPADFIARGFGFCMLQGDAMVGAVSTFVICERGVEIQINVREPHRGKGIGTVLAATFLYHSLACGLDPNWDAANKVSAHLAAKLGYTPQGTYTMFFYQGGHSASG